MGMFDYIVCQFPLPEDENTDDVELQTKDTPAQGMRTYLIGVDGTLRELSSGQCVPYTGVLRFYGSNWGMIRGGIVISTSDHKPPTQWDYQATFVNDRCVQITGGKTIEESELAKEIRRVRRRAT